jgi:CBS domain-containing protein
MTLTRGPALSYTLTVKDAILLMRRKHIRRLGVKKAEGSDNITGIITLCL